MTEAQAIPAIPSAEEVRADMNRLSHGHVRELAVDSGLPFTTLWKIRTGETSDPRLETVRTLLPHLKAAVARLEPAAAAGGA